MAREENNTRASCARNENIFVRKKTRVVGAAGAFFARRCWYSWLVYALCNLKRNNHRREHTNYAMMDGDGERARVAANEK